MGRIHRYGQRKDCLIFNFVATNTIEGRVLRRLLEKLQEIRDALEDDAVFNVVGEVLPAAHIERVLRDYYAGRLGDADLEDRLLQDVDEGQFRSICKNALEGLASKQLNLEMLIERRARAQERRVVPETIARFIAESAGFAGLALKQIGSPAHAFEPGRTPPALRVYEQDPDWRLPQLAARYPRSSTDREAAESGNLEWVTPGHPLFEALRRHMLALARPAFAAGASFWSLKNEGVARIDFYRARVVDGLAQVMHERLFAVETRTNGERQLAEPSLLNDLAPVQPLHDAVSVADDGVEGWLHEQALDPFLAEVRLPIRFKDRILRTHFRADYLCYHDVVVELKALRELGGVEEAQILNYLKASGKSRGLLLNFGTPSLGYRRFILSQITQINTDYEDNVADDADLPTASPK